MTSLWSHTPNTWTFVCGDPGPVCAQRSEPLMILQRTPNLRLHCVLPDVVGGDHCSSSNIVAFLKPIRVAESI
jgi:hypothetical protein